MPLFVGAASPASPGKKLIEYGWDVPTPAQMREDLAAMEKRPFDGLIFRLSGGHNAFVTKPLEPASFAEDERILRSLQFTRFRDNFVLWVAKTLSRRQSFDARERLKRRQRAAMRWTDEAEHKGRPRAFA